MPDSWKGDGKVIPWSSDWADTHKKCVERNCELANNNIEQLCNVSPPCIDDHQFKQDELETVAELSKVCSQIVLKYLHLARIGSPDILWSVNKLARAVTQWTRACNRRSARLVSYIHNTSDFRQYCHVGNTAEQCRLGLFQDSDFAWDLEDSKPLREEICACLEVEPLFKSEGCASSKLQSHTVSQSLR